MGLFERAHSAQRQRAARRKQGLLRKTQQLAELASAPADEDTLANLFLSAEEAPRPPEPPETGPGPASTARPSVAEAVGRESDSETQPQHGPETGAEEAEHRPTVAAAAELEKGERSGEETEARPAAARAVEPDGDTEPGAPEEHRQEMLAALTRARRGFEAPARLFQLLQEELGLTRAALLLYDPLRMVFAPWAACGYDRTTLQRLRIPMGYSSSFDRMASGETLHLSEPADLAQLRSLFSFREFSTLRHAVLVPFLHTRKWIAVLVITEQKPAPWRSDPAFYETLAERAAELLYEARERHIETVAHDGDYLDSLRRELLVRPSGLRALLRRSADAATANGKPLLVVRLDLRGVLSTIQQAAPSFVGFRLSEDVCGLLLALFSSMGTAARSGPDHLLLLLDLAEPADQELLFRHLESALRFYFPSLAERDDLGLAPQVRVWRGAPAQADQVLDSFDS